MATNEVKDRKETDIALISFKHNFHNKCYTENSRLFDRRYLTIISSSTGLLFILSERDIFTTDI